jgi:hypothetical protein
MGATNNYRYVNTSSLTKVSGTKGITSNGTGIDVKTYEKVNVAVPASAVVSGNKAITNNGTNIDVTNYKTCSVAVPASAVTSGTYTYPAGSTGGNADITSYKVVNASNVYAKGVSDGRSLSSQSQTVHFNAGASSGTFTFTFGTKIVGITGVSFGNRGSKITYPQISISGNTVTLSGNWDGDAGNVTVTCVGY